MKINFNSDFEQLYYEINVLLKQSLDSQFSDYLNDTLIEAQQNPSSASDLRSKVITNYELYSRRMKSYGYDVDEVYLRAVYGVIDASESKNPYSNDIDLSAKRVDKQNSQLNTAKKAVKKTRNKTFDFKKVFIEIVKTAVFMALALALFWLVALVGNFITRPIDSRSFVGQIIILVILSAINGNGLGWGNLIISNLLNTKPSVIVGLLWVGFLNLYQLQFINIWVLGVLFIVDLFASMSPLFLRSVAVWDRNKGTN